MEKEPEVSNTLYISRISDKVGINKLKIHIFAYFSQYGQILDISAHRGLKRRGQAWVTYETIESAINAKKDLNNIIIFNSPIKVSFASKRNIATLKLYGIYNPYGRKKETINDNEIEKLTKGPIPYHWDVDMKDENEDEELTVIKPLTRTTEPVAISPYDMSKMSLQEPNKILFVQNIPEETDKSVLEFLFQQYPGFIECRVLPGKGTMAFVEYENEDQSGTALAELNGFEIEDNHKLTIQYAKK